MHRTILIAIMFAVCLPIRAQESDGSIYPVRPDTILTELFSVDFIPSANKAGDSLYTLSFNFSDKHPQFFYNVDTRGEKIVIEFLDAETKFGAYPEVNAGPLRGIQVAPKRVDKNAAIKGMNPDWQFNLEVTVECSPPPRPKTLQVESPYFRQVNFTLPWPESKAARKELYAYDQTTKKIVTWSLIGAGVIGAGAAGIALFVTSQQEDPEEPLRPVLPVHPAPVE
ncbi:MAG: hypothetical protein GF398_14815 [Chitinivibrionales bacterium]|nr:hypothetical protein [Chitinivibrionales bacterium]